MKSRQFLLGIIGAISAFAPALADDPMTEEWQFQITTYVWATAVNSDSTIKGIKTSVDASFIDIVKESDSLFAYNGQFEATKGDFTLQFNPTYMKLGVDDSDVKGGPLNTKIDAEAEITYLELAALYRIGTWPVGYQPTEQTLSIEPLAGVRYTNLRGELDIKFPALNTKISPDDRKDWFDPFIGARTILKLTEEIDLQLRGDVGGFGVGSDFTWQAAGVLTHEFSLFGKTARAIAGYRALYQDYEDGSGGNKFKWDATLHGPILGLTVQF